MSENELWLGYRFKELWDGISIWSQKTFGSDLQRGPIGPLKHLEKEAREAQDKPDDVMEYADCLILVMDSARRAGIPLSVLLNAAHKKMDENQDRTWPNPTGTDEPIEHVRELDT